MPGKKPDGSLNDVDHWYCDGNQVDGTFCPEFDIMEANTYAFKTTPHSCDAPNENGFFSQCDRWGSCEVGVPDDMDFGPGSNYRIDTREEFHVRTHFNQDDEGEFTGYTTLISQG